MKATNIPPVKLMSGTQNPDKELEYYAYQGKQVIRRYSHPPAPYNPSFNQAKDWNDAILTSWRALSGPQFKTWRALTDEWNRQIAQECKTLNPYLAFFKVNFYRLLHDVGIEITPPIPQPYKSLTFCDFSVDPSSPGSILVNYTVSNLPTTGFKCLLWTTIPHSNFLHAYRHCERKLISGLVPASVFEVAGTDGQYQWIIPSPARSFAGGDSFHLESQLIGPDYFPHLRISRASVLLEDRDMISLGVKWHVIAAAGSHGEPYQYCQGWTTDDVHRGLVQNDDDRSLYVPFSYYPDSIVTGIRLCWKAPAGPLQRVFLRFAQDDSTPSWNSWEADLGGDEIASNGTGNVQVDALDVTPFTIGADKVYCVIVEPWGGTSNLVVYDISIRTSKRVY